MQCAGRNGTHGKISACVGKKEVVLRRAGILPTRAGSIVPAHLQMCRKLLCEVLPSYEIYVYPKTCWCREFCTLVHSLHHCFTEARRGCSSSSLEYNSFFFFLTSFLYLFPSLLLSLLTPPSFSNVFASFLPPHQLKIAM